MKTKGILFFALLGLYSCEVTDSQNSLPLSLEEKLKEVMNMPRDFPPGKLSNVVVYGGDSEQVHDTREIYYPAIGNVSVHVIRDRNQDTVGIGLNYFRDELLETSHSFNFENGKPIWWSTKEYQYLSGNRVDKIFSTSANKERSLLAQYVYNSQNLLTQIEYPFVNGVELHVYEYDSLGRISVEWKSAKGQEKNKIDYLIYRYSEGLLAAKESGIRGIIGEDRQDAFQYFHDAQGRVIMQKEFDPYFGFQQKSRSEFFYHTSGSK